VLRRASAVLGTGKVAVSALSKMGCPLSKLLDFPYFVDLDKFSFSPRSEARRRVVFGSVARLHRCKGCDLALQAFANVAADRSIDFRYRIAGTGPEADSLRTLSAKLGISDRVEFLGWLNPDQLLAFYSSIDFLLHPARTEPFGVSILEAMASGAIVIASDQTAAAVDRVSDGVNGFLHASGNVNSLAACISNALRLGSDEKTSIRVRARQTAESWPTSRGVHIISELLRRMNGAPREFSFSLLKAK
jgi:glycosyltransferase involved in cell wall biosynthesis